VYDQFVVADSQDFSEICNTLEMEYGKPDPEVPPLGNVLDSLDELVYIMLTTMTEYGPSEVFKKLKERYKVWDEVLYNPKADFFSCIKLIGLVNQRGSRIISSLKKIKSKFGSLTLVPLNDMDNKDVEEFLTSLPGMGKKTSRCVMMYSLNREVFPVDTHVLRICRRLMLINPGISWTKAHDILQDAVLPKDRYSLHVNLVIHGNKICKAKMPKCNFCILNDMCPVKKDFEAEVE